MWTNQKEELGVREQYRWGCRKDWSWRRVKGSDTVVWTEADGCPVNLESNLIGKYAERLLQGRGQIPRPTVSIDTDSLQQRGLT